MKPSASTVHIVEENDSCLIAIARLLNTLGYAVQTYKTRADFLRRMDSDPVGCLLLNLAPPDGCEIDIQRAVAAHTNPLPVVFLVTGRGQLQDAVRALGKGTCNFITNDTTDGELIQTVQMALDQDMQGRVRKAAQSEIRHRFDRLTHREREVIACVVHGFMNKETAAALSLSERTVKHHRTRANSKLQVQSVAQLILILHEADLLRELNRQIERLQSVPVPVCAG